MKNSFFKWLILVLFSGIAGIIFAFTLYYFFPQFLCYGIYDVSESNLYEVVNCPVESQYREMFSPLNRYLKSVTIHVGKTDEKLQNQYMEVKLYNSKGRLLAKDKVALDDIGEKSYCEFAMETWLYPEETYEIVISFPKTENMYITMGSYESGPAEHISLTIEGEESKKNLYFKYIYGNYSKKLLLLWYLVFCISAYFVGDAFWEKWIRKEDEKNGIQ